MIASSGFDSAGCVDAPDEPLPIARFAPAPRRRIVGEIGAWERDEFGGGQCRDPETLDARIGRFDQGLLCLVERGLLLGYVDIVPLSPAGYAALREGRVMEERMDPAWIVPPDAGLASHWYIGSMMVARDARSSVVAATRKIAAQLELATWRFFAARGGFPQRILAIGATETGRAMLTATGFERVLMPADAVDTRPRYERVNHTPVDIDRLVRRLTGAGAG